MKALLEEIHAVVFAEYMRASAKFGPANNSPHESFAVILEEYEEAVEQGETFKVQLDCFWEEVKCNLSNTGRLAVMRELAEHAAAEWVQVAAMCHKAMVSKGD